VKILAIETSCDETAVAVLEAAGSLEKPEFKILGNSLLSQIDIHKEFGGVVPMLAKREHEKNLPILLEKTLKEAGLDLDKPDLEVICVTAGPGLEPALWTGIVFAKELGEKWGIQVLPINHMEGHIASVLFAKDKEVSIHFPALALLVSGGHTELIHIKDYGTYDKIGSTRDDAVGEAFDKVARLLGLPYPGGPEISRLAEIHRSKGLTPSFDFPRPMITSPDYDFSYSGLKTSALYKLKEVHLTTETQEEMARAFEDAAVEVLIKKTEKALQNLDAKTLIVAGGVSMNTHLRRELVKLAQRFEDTELLLPIPSLTTDNAVMIGMTGYLRILKDPSVLTRTVEIKATGNLSL
jgi:N6-L-threonylcarbamoyladenine synthase